MPIVPATDIEEDLRQLKEYWRSVLIQQGAGYLEGDWVQMGMHEVRVVVRRLNRRGKEVIYADFWIDGHHRGFNHVWARLRDPLPPVKDPHRTQRVKPSESLTWPELPAS